MKKISPIIIVTLMTLLISGCTLGTKQNDVANQPQNIKDSLQNNTGDDTVEKPTPEVEQPKDKQKQEQNPPKDFDPNSYNDEEINELIAMLEGIVEVE